MKKRKETIYHWNIMCDKCHKIISKKYTEDILAKVREEGRTQALVDEIGFLKEISGLLSHTEVDKAITERISKLQEQVGK